jgi:acyl-CoA thioesterase FadM
MVDGGVDMVVAEARILYRSPLLFDDEFEGRAEIARLGDTSMMAEILLARDGAPVAEGELRYVFVESGGGSTAPIPEPIRAGLARYQQADGP